MRVAVSQGTVAQNEAEEVGRNESERSESLEGVLFSQQNLYFILFFHFIDIINIKL